MIALKSPPKKTSVPQTAAELSPQQVVDAFHKLYLLSEDAPWKRTFWMGQHLYKCPLDVWVYQELLYEQQPDLIIECGTLEGGSALFLSNMCDLLGKGRVLTIDISPPEGKPQHPRLTYLQGSSTAPEIVARVKREIKPGEKVLVILDSDHHKEHVLNELRAYHSLVSPGCYLIVEDSNVNGHPVGLEFGPGPMEAMEEFFRENRDFEIDASREKHFLSFNPRGYLKKVR
jgi:cephalosporin hydroxylase